MSMDRADFTAISKAASVKPTSSDIQFVGDGDPIYPSPLRLASGVASILGNIAGVVDEIRLPTDRSAPDCADPHGTGRRRHLLDVGAQGQRP